MPKRKVSTVRKEVEKGLKEAIAWEKAKKNRIVLGEGKLVIYTNVTIKKDHIKIEAHRPQSVGLHTAKGRSKRLKMPELILGKKVRLVVEVVG